MTALAALAPVDLYCDTPDAVCKRCGEVYPHTPEHFARNGNGKPGRTCRSCYREYQRERHSQPSSFAEREAVAAENKKLLVGSCYECKQPLKRGEAGLCKRCMRQAWGKMGGQQIGGGESLCLWCKWTGTCRERIRQDLWVICEQPSIGDLRRVAQGHQPTFELLKGRYEHG